MSSHVSLPTSRQCESNQLAVRPSRLVRIIGERFCLCWSRSCGTVFRMTLHFASSLTVFRRKLKTRLFSAVISRHYYVGSLLVIVLAVVVLAVVYLGHIKNC